jgi:hypothetical protein
MPNRKFGHPGSMQKPNREILLQAAFAQGFAQAKWRAKKFPGL